MVFRFLTNETDHFVTLLFGRLVPGARSFIGVNGGHPPGYVLNRGVCDFCQPDRPADDITAIVVKVGPEPDAQTNER